MQQISQITDQNVQFPEVPEMFKNGYPIGYLPWISGWSFSVEKLKEKLPDGTYKLLTLDLSINDDDYIREVNDGPANDLSKRAEEKYKCEIGCKHCFECKTDTNNPLMSFEEVKHVVLEAKNLGLETVKFLGPGELLHNPKLFEILDFFEEEKIKIGIFTKGIILGDDEMSQKIFGMNSHELCQKLFDYSCVTLLIGFVSPIPEVEHKRLETKIIDFSGKRNRGIENASDVGFNKDPQNQRMAFICTPILHDNIGQAFEIFEWALKRNIPVILAPTMVSGKGLDMAEIQDDDFKEKDLISLFVKVYRRLIEQKIFTFLQIEREGVSPYAGVGCNQFVCGMFVRKDGRIQACAGNESENFRYAKDIRHDDLRSVWVNCLGYKLRKELIETGKITTTQPCYAKTEGLFISKGSIPKDFYQTVLEKLR